MDKRILILNKERISWKLQRMAYEIWEHNSKETSITMIGIDGSGLAVAKDLAKRVKKISGIEVETLTIKMNKKNPLAETSEISEDLTGKSVVVVDDVANSGKTLLYAIRSVLTYEPKRILMAVLVDRKHKSFPVSADIVGHSVATTLQEHIEVVCTGDEITAAYLQ
jgi:pyrimidine operon attenuation protein/uracil phosphoribosyltransferase